MTNKDFLIRLMALRKMELGVSKHMTAFTGDDMHVTFSDLTRKLAKDHPKLLVKIDELLEEF